MPVDFDQTLEDAFSYAGRKEALQPLRQAMNAYLNEAGLVVASGALPEKGAPFVYLGSSEGENAPPAAEMMRVEHDKYPPMVIYLEKPSKQWQAAAQELAQKLGVDYLMVIRIGFSEYPKADKGMFGKKVVLGTGYEYRIRFLSAEDKPVEVLQVTGMLVDRNGKVIRAGGEGFLSKDTPFWAQIFDVYEGSSNDALQQLMEARREDLAGTPLTWQVALRNLVLQLQDQKDLVIQ